MYLLLRWEFLILRIKIFDSKILSYENYFTLSLIAGIFCHWGVDCSSLEGLSMKHAVEKLSKRRKLVQFSKAPSHSIHLVQSVHINWFIGKLDDFTMSRGNKCIRRSDMDHIMWTIPYVPYHMDHIIWAISYAGVFQSCTNVWCLFHSYEMYAQFQSFAYEDPS